MSSGADDLVTLYDRAPLNAVVGCACGPLGAQELLKCTVIIGDLLHPTPAIRSQSTRTCTANHQIQM